MMKVEIRLLPGDELQTLDWVTDTLTAIKSIHDFVLDAIVRSEVTEDADQRSAAAVETIIQGRAAEIGTPYVRLREGSLLLELSQLVDATVPVQEAYSQAHSAWKKISPRTARKVVW